jgi:hypothetical protein
MVLLPDGCRVKAISCVLCTLILYKEEWGMGKNKICAEKYVWQTIFKPSLEVQDVVSEQLMFR